MTRLEATLDDIVGKLRGNGFPNEQAIKQGVVLPVLRDLNWNIYDTDIVWPEYKVPSSQRVDFALCHPAKKPQVFIEVKQPGAAKGGLEQVFNYAYLTTVEYAVLTDGRTWRFYLPRDKGDLEERCVYMLDLLQRSTGESADALQRYLERNGVVSGEIHRVASKDLKSRRNRANIRKTWNSLIDKHERSLIDLLADSTQAETGDRPEVADIIGFLASLRQQSSASLALPRGLETNTAERPPAGADTPDVMTPRDDTPTPVEAATPATKKRLGRPSQWDGRIIRSTCAENPRRRGSKGWHAHNFIMEHPNGVSYEDYRAAEHTSDHLAWDLKRGWIAVEKKDRSSPLGRETNAPVPPTTDTRSIVNVTIPRRGTLRILGEEIAYKNAMDAVLIILKHLHERDRNFLLNFYRHPRNKGRSRRHVAKKTEELYEKKPDLRKYNAQIDDGWLLATNQNKQGKKAVLQIAVEVTGLTLGRDIVVDL